MPAQQMEIRPEDVPQFLAQQKAELEAVTKVLDLKRRALELAHKMEEHANLGSIGSALACMAEIQDIEYTLFVGALMEKVAQLEHNIAQLESPIHRASTIPPFRVPRV